jgi:membrane protease YdiL (CAAX protease family)
LLFLCYYSLGFWPAVAVNIALYATTHIPKGAGETIGTFPYGLLLCYVTISTGSILVAFTTHFVMALSNDIFSIYHSKEMTFSK